MPCDANESAPARTSARVASARGGVAGSLFRAMRPRQWIKNAVIFAALVFSHTLTEPAHLLRSAAAFLLFCGISSAVYLLNDILDLKNDRAHPTKSKRPIAAGEISIPLACAVGVALAGGSLALAAVLSLPFAALALVYLASNLFYSMWLKRVVIVDVMIISSGFVIRAVAGGVVIGVEVSAWLILCTIFLSLFLGFTKRRQELALLEERATSHREILREYSIAFLDQTIAIVTSATLVAYFLYTLAPETRAKFQTPWLPLTIPFVIYGIFRYLYLVHHKQMGESPTSALYADRPLLVTILLWAATAVAILYLR
ncbi:MAG TPA: decaprenyl-phosphate phosphoribosyltransferase [Candidatus Polarisedimenticolia bacterium]|nr:decaprenyl-phosphate phosphoribosyltransferase [Candidatus Polarisedimenticolia bacterium]